MRPLDLTHASPDSSSEPSAVFIFAHGAGADKDSEFMLDIAQRLHQHNIAVVRFNFDYMQLRAEDGKKRPPDRMPKLQACFQEVIQQVAKTFNQPIWIGGKSMGGRVASLIAESSEVKGFIALGFPFHAPGKPPKDRIEHLENYSKPSLILQGTRDTMGNSEEVAEYDISQAISIHWLEDGDHSLKPRKKSGFSYEQHLAEAAQQIAEFIQHH